MSDTPNTPRNPEEEARRVAYNACGLPAPTPLAAHDAATDSDKPGMDMSYLSPEEQQALAALTASMDAFLAYAANDDAGNDADADGDPATPAEIRARRDIALEARDRAYARRTRAEQNLHAAALDVRLSIVDACVEYQKATATAKDATREYDEAEAADLIANPPAAKIADAERAAIDAAQFADKARAAFLSLLEGNPGMYMAHKVLADAEKSRDAAIEQLRAIVTAAANTSDLRGGQGYTKAAVIARGSKATVSDPVQMFHILRAHSLAAGSDSPDAVAAIAGAISYKMKELQALNIPNLPIVTVPTVTVSIHADKLKKGE